VEEGLQFVVKDSIFHGSEQMGVAKYAYVVEVCQPWFSSEFVAVVYYDYFLLVQLEFVYQ